MGQVEKLTQTVNAVNPIKGILIRRFASEGSDSADSTVWNKGAVHGLQRNLLLHGTSKTLSKTRSIGWRRTVGCTPAVVVMQPSSSSSHSRSAAVPTLSPSST
jgi:hypothetical protein